MLRELSLETCVYSVDTTSNTEQHPSLGWSWGLDTRGGCHLAILAECWADSLGVAMGAQEKRRLRSDCWVQLHLEEACITPLAEHQVGVSVHNELLFFEALH
jgi:hypothetical protein